MLARGFVWDDSVLRDRQATIGQWKLFAPDAFGFVRPGKAALFSLMETLFGDRTAGWQAFALLTLLAAALLLWRWARTLIGPRGALIAALIYAVHPLHVEATGWFSAVNGTVMIVLALLYYLMIARVALRPTAGGLIGLTLLFLAAMLMKEDAVVVPLVGCLSLWLLGRRPPRSLSVAIGVQYALAAALVWKMRSGSLGAGQELEIMPYADWLISLHAPWMIVLHSLAYVFPFRWVYYYYYQPTPLPFALMTAAGLSLLASLALLAWRRRRRPDPLLFGLLMAVVALAPVVNLLPMRNTWFGVRYLAHAGIGLSLALGWLLARATESPVLRRSTSTAPVFRAATGVVRIDAALGLAVWLLAAGATAVHDHWFWRSDPSLFVRMVEEHDSPLMNATLANVRFKRGDYAQAERLARRAIEKGHPRANPHVILGMALARQGRMEPALDAWRQAERMEPLNVDMAMNLGYYHDERYAAGRDRGDFENADRYYALAAGGSTENAETAAVNRGLLWVQNGDLRKGVKIWEDGLAKFPGSAELTRNLSIARRQLAALAQTPNTP
jgi:hypothetical protein